MSFHRIFPTTRSPHPCLCTRTHAHTRTEFVSSSFLGRMLGKVSFLFRRSYSLSRFHPVIVLPCQSGLRVCCIHSRSTFLSHSSHLLISLESIALKIHVRFSVIRGQSEWVERIICTGEPSTWCCAPRVSLAAYGCPLVPHGPQAHSLSSSKDKERTWICVQTLGTFWPWSTSYSMSVKWKDRMMTF